MTSIYTKIQRDLTRETKKWKHSSGAHSVIVQKLSYGPSDPATPYLQGAKTIVEYVLDALVSGVDEDLADGSLILVTDQIVTSPPFGKVNGVVTALLPSMEDLIKVDGKVRQIKKTQRTPPLGEVVNIGWFIAG